MENLGIKEHVIAWKQLFDPIYKVLKSEDLGEESDQSRDEGEEDYQSKDEGEESIKNFKVILDKV